MNFRGTIIEESLIDKSVLDDIEIISTKISPVTEKSKTPWITQWTMHDVKIASNKVTGVVEKISGSLDSEHADSWYADFKNEKEHYIIYPNKVFHITDRSYKTQYDDAIKYGISIGIPEYQVTPLRA